MYLQVGTSTFIRLLIKFGVWVNHLIPISVKACQMNLSS